MGLLASSWVHSYRSSPWARMMHSATYTREQRHTVETLLQRGISPNILEAPDGAVIAWALTERHGARHILHYVWVNKEMRQCGIARKIAAHVFSPSDTVVTSHMSDVGLKIMSASLDAQKLLACANSPYARFNPTLAHNPAAFVAI